MSKWELRDYQQDIIKKAALSSQSGKNGIIMVAPTAAGKMATLSYIAQRSNRRVLILFHVVDLVDQCVMWLDRWCGDYDIIGTGYQGKRVAVGTMQKYYSQRNKIEHNYDLIIIDEGHHVKASTYENIFDLMPKAKRLAFTATPIRLDGQGLIDNKYFDDLIIGITAKELVERKMLAPIKVFSHPCDIDFTKISMRGGDYNKKEISELMEDLTIGKIMGNTVEYYRKYVDGQPALVCCQSIKHSEIVADQLNKSGIKSVAVHSKMDRSGIIESYKRGEIKVLTYCQVFGEGVDLPDATAMFYMRKTASLSVWMQNCGRVARMPRPDKIAYVFDHVGQYYTTFGGDIMGHPYKDRDWKQIIYNQQEVKRKRSKKIPKIYDRCDSCLTVFDAGLQNCPNCDYNNTKGRERAAKLKKIEGQLKEIEEQERVESQVITEGLSSLQTLKEYQTYARFKGYKSGWAWHKFKNRNKGIRRVQQNTET